MTWLELYAYFGAPLTMCAVAYGLYLYASHEAGKPDEPAEKR